MVEFKFLYLFFYYIYTHIKATVSFTRTRTYKNKNFMAFFAKRRDVKRKEERRENREKTSVDISVKTSHIIQMAKLYYYWIKSSCDIFRGCDCIQYVFFFLRHWYGTFNPVRATFELMTENLSIGPTFSCGLTEFFFLTYFKSFRMPMIL